MEWWNNGMMGRARGQRTDGRRQQKPVSSPKDNLSQSSPAHGGPLRAQRISLTEPAGNTEKNLKRLKAEKSLSLTEATEITGNYNHISTDSAD